MMKELVFYTNPQSRGRVVHWMLEEIGAPYAVEVKDYGTTMKAPDYLTINPMGKVPAIKHGEVVVTETPAICAYLADAFPEAGLAPEPSARGAYYRWLFFAAGCVEPAMSNHLVGWDPAKIETYNSTFFLPYVGILKQDANGHAAELAVAVIQLNCCMI
jgi:glutathione S-transferase